MPSIFEDQHDIHYLETVVEFTKVCKNLLTHEITHVRLHGSEQEFALQFRKVPEIEINPPEVKETPEVKEIPPPPPPKPRTKPQTKPPIKKPEPEVKEPTPPEFFPIGTKVLQISGKSPCVGVGTVASHLNDGRIKVRFFKHIKVLTPDKFRRATETELEK